MIVVTAFLLIMNQAEFPVVHNCQQESCHYDHIPLNSNGIRKDYSVRIIFPVWKFLAGRPCSFYARSEKMNSPSHEIESIQLDPCAFDL